MASIMIHMAVAHEINKKLKKDYKKIIIGSMAPDISKILNGNRAESHFLNNKKFDVPDLNKFLKKYKNNLSDDFVLGYYIHLYTDYLWETHFINKTYDLNKNIIKFYDGNIFPYDYNLHLKYVYIDYTSLDYSISKKYNINIYDIISNVPKLNNIIEEIDLNKINEFFIKYKNIYENNHVEKTMLFDFEQVNMFINYAANEILDNLKD